MNAVNFFRKNFEGPRGRYVERQGWLKGEDTSDAKISMSLNV